MKMNLSAEPSKNSPENEQGEENLCCKSFVFENNDKNVGRGKNDI